MNRYDIALKKPAPKPASKPEINYYMGIDAGFHGPSSIAVCHKVGNNLFIDYYDRQIVDVNGFHEWVVDLGRRFKIKEVLGDNFSGSLLGLGKRLGIPVTSRASNYANKEAMARNFEYFLEDNRLKSESSKIEFRTDDMDALLRAAWLCTEKDRIAPVLKGSFNLGIGTVATWTTS
jgi:hypothetical protein